MGLKHLFESAAPPAPNPALIDGPNWNDDHYFLTAGHAALGALGDLPYRGTGGLVTLLAGAAGVLQSAGSGSVPAYTLDPTLTSLTVTGAITAGSIVITGGGGTISGPELGVLDGVTPGVVLASKAVVVDANKDIASFRNLTAVNLIATTLITTPLVNGTTTLGLQTAGVTRWSITAAGHLLAGVDNTYDVGAVGATRPRTVYAGTSVVTPLVTVATAVAIGVNPSTVGAIRLPNSTGIYFRNIANTADIAAVAVDNGNIVNLGTGAVAVKSAVGYGSPVLTGTLVTNDTQNIANAGIVSLGPDTVGGLLAVVLGDRAAVFFLPGTHHGVALLSQAGWGGFTVAAGTASSFNVYWSAANSRYEAQNNLGFTVGVRFVRLGY